MAKNTQAGKTSSPENKTEHLHILISPSEISAIEDWGFSNRIRTKAEATRKLCQIGILSYDRIREVLSAVQSTSEHLRRVESEIKDSVVDAVADPTAAAKVVNDRLAEVVRFLDEANSRALRLAEQMRFIQSTPDFDADYEKAEAASGAATSLTLTLEEMLK